MLKRVARVQRRTSNAINIFVKNSTNRCKLPLGLIDNSSAQCTDGQVQQGTCRDISISRSIPNHPFVHFSRIISTSSSCTLSASSNSSEHCRAHYTALQAQLLRITCKCSHQDHEGQVCDCLGRHVGEILRIFFNSITFCVRR